MTDAEKIARLARFAAHLAWAIWQENATEATLRTWAEGITLLPSPDTVTAVLDVSATLPVYGYPETPA